MKRLLKGSVSLLLAVLLLVNPGGVGIASAAEAIDKALNPAEQIELTVPERFQDGNNWFFIPEQSYAASETSQETLYIPIQRTGDLDSEAEVTLKVSDISARHDVNYKVELYKDDTDPAILLDDQSLVDLIQNADEQEEYEPVEDADQFGQLVDAVGGAEILDENGDVAGTVTATPLDENGNPIQRAEETPAEEDEESEEAEDSQPVTPGEVEESDWTEGAGSPTDALRAARNAYTGTVSDRQELEGGDLYDFNAADLTSGNMTEEEYNEQMADLAIETYPGKEYTLRFAAGEEAKFLAVTPMYSEAAEGDAQIMLLLKKPGQGWAVGEDVNPVSITIFDEDEPEPVTVSMAEEEVTAEDGVAKITVTREGRLNAIKGVTLASWDGSATQGDEYSGIGAKLYFPVGITSRTVEIPVYHGTEEKDFYVSITALEDETIGTATTHVIIPAAGEDEDGEEEALLMQDGDNRVHGAPITGAISMKGGYIEGSGSWENNYLGAEIHTPVDKPNVYEKVFVPLSKYGYAYDGVLMDWWAHVSYCDGDVWMSYWPSSGAFVAHSTGVNNRDNNMPSGSLYNYFGSPAAPNYVSFETKNNNNHGTKFVDSFISAHVSAAHLIKRKFNIVVESPQVKPLLGVSNTDVLKEYEAVNLDGKANSRTTLWTDDAFSVSAKVEKGPLRMAGLEAKSTSGSWVRIVTLDGKSQLANVTMNADKINELAGKNLISWSAVSRSGWQNSYVGTLTVRPVYEYQDVTVELKQDSKGKIYMSAPSGPSLLWDFDKDGTFTSKMGKNWGAHELNWWGSSSSDDPSYYIFNATGGDPYVSIDTPYPDASALKWVKIKYYNNDKDAGDNKLELFASCGNAGTNIGPTNVRFNLQPMGNGWKEDVFPINNANWKGEAKWFRLDPMVNSVNTGRICIDYIAFFSSEAAARAWKYDSRASTGTEVSEPGVYTYHLGDKISYRTEMTTAGKNNNLKGDGVSYQIKKFGENGTMKDWIDVHYINGKTKIELSGKTIGGDIVDRPYYTMKPTFTENGNSVTVEVSKAALAYLDTSMGIFKSGNYVSRTESGSNWIYTIKKDVHCNEEIDLDAYTKDPDAAMVGWLFNGSSRPEWQDSTSLRTGERSEYNRVKLRVKVFDSGSLLSDDEGILLADEDDIPVYAVVTGTVASSTFNLSTERSAVDVLPAKSAFVACGSAGAWTDEDGHFELPAFRTMAGGQIRYTVTYNGVTSIQTAKIPAANAPKSQKLTVASKSVQAVTANTGVVQVENFDENGVHFASAYAEQEGKIFGALNGMYMNGKELRVTVNVDKGEPYLLNGQPTEEHVKDVTLYFMDQLTGEVHAQFSSNTTPSRTSPAKWSYDDATGVFTLVIPTFGPENPTDWTYGDVLMARLTTDKQSGISKWTQEQNQKYAWDESREEWVLVPVTENDRVDMVYEPVSTGIAVAADPDYEPQVMDFSYEKIAEQLGITPKTDKDGNLMADDDTEYSFGSFPYIGEITATINVISKVVSSASTSAEMDDLMDDLEDMAGDASSTGATDGDDSSSVSSWSSSSSGSSGSVSAQDQAPADGGKEKKKNSPSVNILLRVENTVWGGVRFMFGVMVSHGTGKGYQKQRSPFLNVQNFIASNSTNLTVQAMDAAADLIFNAPVAGDKELKSDYGGGYFKFSAFLGVYFDYGYVEISKNGGTEKSHEMIFMGAGGFIGFNGNLGYTWSFMAGPVPMYINVDVGLNVTFYLSSSGNPTKTLQGFKNDSELHGKDFQFNFEFKGRLYASGTIGVGWYKILGVRITVGVGFDAGYGLNITDWYPDLFDTGWGYTSDITFTGSIDLVITSIDIYSATWPLPISGGYLEYFQEMKRANRCITYVEAGLKKNQGKDPERRAQVERMLAELKGMVDANKMLAAGNKDKKPQLTSADTINKKTTDLKNYAWHSDIISFNAVSSIEANKQTGVVGAIVNGTLQSDETEGLQYHTNEHVNSSWVADDGQLMAAYGNASSKAIVENAFAQPSSKILSIGSGKYLMVFLDDTASRDKTQAATLKWTVYDTAKDTWTTPQIVQNDKTVDGKPHLADAGNKVVLSWSSITDAKYNKLKSDVATELKRQTGAAATDAAIQAALEKDPARLMAQMDIFSVEFDKGSQTFGGIQQLTDDQYYDDYPQAVYDSKTGDYIVLYYKTAQDDGEYSNPGDRLQDLVSASPDPEKTYSVICYMIHNGKADTNAGYKDDSGAKATVPAGWVTHHLYDGEVNAQSLAAYGGVAHYLETWGGQRFLPSTLRDENGGQSDPPIIDLTVAAGYNGLAAYAFTVDQDFNLKTTEDRALYLEFYDFEDHSTYVPIKVAGSVTEEKERYNSAIHDFETYTATREVEVGSPKLARNGGDTYLFWREDGQSLKYLNVSEMLNAKVAAVANPGNRDSDWTYAVREDGTFATDASTGRIYEPHARKVDFGSLLTEADIEITDYDVITAPNGDEEDLYIVWTDAVSGAAIDQDGVESPFLAQEIYASAMIHQEKQTVTVKDENGRSTTETAQTVRWSKPYRLTRENNFNDGLALALDPKGNLMVLHNQYSKRIAKSEGEMMDLIDQGKIGVTKGPNGQLYAASLSYNSPVNLVLTRFEKIGSLEATAFEFSDYYPVAGETVTVTAAIENVGLTDAKGCKIDFYENKNGKRGRKIGETVTYNDTIQVNTARAVSLDWTVPADGPGGYRIEAVISEKNGSGYYGAVSSFSEAFTVEPFYRVKATDVTQEGDKFRVKFTASNAGNKAAEEGTTLSVRLTGLYGELSSDRYGNLESNELYSEDVTKKLTGKTLGGALQGEDLPAAPQSTDYEGDVAVEIPVSVFRYCGYDALQIVMTDKAGNILAESDQTFLQMDAPVNLRLNDRKPVLLKAGEKAQVSLTYDSTVFVDGQLEQNGSVVYSVEDPEIAAVDEEGNVTALRDGVTKLIATLLPSGRRVSVAIHVGEGTYATCDREEDCLLSAFTDLNKSKWYHDGVHWALDNGVMAGYGKGKFGPNDITTRAQIVRMLWNMEGNPVVDGAITFKDVPAKTWYTEAVRWAASEDIIAGYSAEKFGPNDPLTREQLASILRRYALYKEMDAGAYDDPNRFTDGGRAGRWARESLGWAVGAGVIAGMGDNILGPKSSATRAQAAAMLLRFQELVA